MRCVILHSSACDPIAKVATAACENIQVLHVDELVPYLRIDDWPSTAKWAGDSGILKLLDGAFCVNRIFELNGTKLAQKLLENSCSDLWGYNILGDALELCSGVACDHGPKGVSRALLPLNSQWWYLSQEATLNGLVKFPRFFYPFGATEAKVEDFERPLYTSVWNIFNWRDRGRNTIGIDRFVIDRPRGTPILCYYFDETVESFQLENSKAKLDMNVVKLIADRCRNVFRSAFGEFLIFVDGESITFAGFSPKMETCSAHQAFHRRCAGWLLSVSDPQMARPLAAAPELSAAHG